MRDSDLPPNARLHIAQLSETANKENLRDRFEKYGTIYEIYVNTNKGFGFIQYASAAEAAKAIAAENTSFFEGKHIGVRLAQKDRFGNTINTDDRGRPAASRGQDPFLDRDRDRERDRDLDRYRERDLPLRDLPLRSRERSPHRDRYDDRYYDKFDRGRDLYERDREDVRRRDQFFEDRLPPVRDRYDDLYPPEDDYRREAVFRDRERDRDRDRERDRERDRRDPLERGRSRDILDRDILDRDILDRDIRERDVRERDIRERDSLPRDSRDAYDRRAPRHPEPALIDPLPPVSAPPPLPPAEKPIDCEILLMGKHLRDYADLVERRIKALSLNTGLLLIANESSLTQALEDVTRRKVLYAIILTSQNEVHRSVTLNILHGSPQEHRNMPLEDALALVDRNFSTYLQDRAVPVKSSSSSAPTAPMAPLPGEPPLPKSQPPLPPTPQPPAPPAAPAALAVPAVELTIPQLINLLADRKQLTLSEMDRVISHLQAVRRKMAIEQGLNPDPPAVASSAPAPTITKSVQQPIVAPVVAPAPAKPVDPKQAELQAKILSIFNPSGSSSTAAATSAANKTTMATVSRPSMAASFMHGGSLSSVTASQAAKAAPTSKSAGDINFDSPVVQKVLDKLILSGPTMLKKLATSANGTASISTFSRTQASNSKGVKDPKSQSRVTPKAGLSRQDSDAQLRAAQQAALKTLQQQENATMVVQSNMTRQIPPTPAAVMQNQYPPGMVQYPQPAQYQQQQAVYQQQQQAAYQQQQQQAMVQYPQQQYQQPNMQQQQPLATSPTPLLPDPVDKKGRGWPRGWNPPGVQSTGGQQTGHQQGFQSSAQPNLQQSPHMNQNSRASYQQQQQNRGYLGNRSQPKPPGI